MAYSDSAPKQYGGISEGPPIPYDTVYPTGYQPQQQPTGYQALLPPATPTPAGSGEEREDADCEVDSEAGKIPVEHLKVRVGLGHVTQAIQYIQVT